MKTCNRFNLHIFILILFVPALLWAQSSPTDTLSNNHNLVQLIGLITPLAVSPYLTLLLSCLASTFGIGGGYLEANPALNNPYLLWISVFLFLATLIPNTSKVSKPFGLALSYMEEYAVFVIYAIIFLLPFITGIGNQLQYIENHVVPNYKLGGINVSFSEILFICCSVPMLIVIITVRYFLDILIFISPIPMLDSFFEMCKLAFTAGLFALYILYPPLAIVVSALVFLICYLFYKKAKIQLGYFRYLFLNPLIQGFRKRTPQLCDASLPYTVENDFEKIELAVKVIAQTSFPKIPNKSIVWLVKSGNQLYISKQRWLAKEIIYPLQGPFRMKRDLHAFSLVDSQQHCFQFNSFYKPLYNDIARITGSTDEGLTGLASAADSIKKKGLETLDLMASFIKAFQEKQRPT